MRNKGEKSNEKYTLYPGGYYYGVTFKRLREYGSRKKQAQSLRAQTHRLTQNLRARTRRLTQNLNPNMKTTTCRIPRPWERGTQLKKAQDYLDFTAFSYTGLIDQLEFEGYTYQEALYGVDNCGADWNEQAAKRRRSIWNSWHFPDKG